MKNKPMKTGPRPWLRALSILLCAAIAALSLSACGSNDLPEASDSSDGASSYAQNDSQAVPSGEDSSEPINDEPYEIPEGSIFEESEEYTEEDYTYLPEEVTTSTEDGIDYSRLLARKNQVYTVGSSKLYLTNEEFTPKDPSRYTLMIYMTGSNLESQKGKATFDILEMLDSGVDLTKVNLILYTGGSQTWKTNIPSSSNSVIDLSLDPSEYIVASTEGNADMGAAETLESFIDFATEYYPADYYGLVFWDHGGGPLWGYGSDELFDADSLLLSEMKEAMSGTIFASGTKLEFVGFDACLMGSYEVMSLWSSYAKYYIGSEELEPGDGWDYHFLSVFNDENADAEAIGRAIVDSFGAYYDALRSDTYNPEVTLSLIDLSKVKETSAALESLFKQMAAGLKTGDYAALQKHRNNAKAFGIVETRSSGIYYYDLVDLKDFITEVSSLYPTQAASVLSCLDTLVVHQTASVDHAGGVSLYYPCQNKGQFEKLASSYRSIASSDAYIGFLDGISTSWLYSKSRDWEITGLTNNGDEITFQMSEDQLANTTNAYYSVIYQSESGAYSTYLSNCLITPDADGVLHIPTNPDLFAVTSDSGKYAFWPVRQVEDTDERGLFRTVNSGFATHPDGTSFDYGIEQIGISMLITDAHESGEVAISSITRNQSVSQMGTSDTVNVEDYEVLLYIFYDTYPTYDLQGHLLPITQWEYNTSAFSITTLGYNESVTVQKVPAAEFEGELLVQLVLEDTNGEKYASELTPLNEVSFTDKTEDTPLGQITYRIFEDHVEVYNYVGSDGELTIPSQVDGIPVTMIDSTCFAQSIIGVGSTIPQLVRVSLPDTITQIGGHAFRNCRYLVDVNLPEGLEFIGNQAFEGTALSSMVLPSSVTFLGCGVFAECRSLESVTLPPSLDYLGAGLFFECPLLHTIEGEAAKGYQLKDGVLFNEDGTILLAYPQAREGSYAVPEGTQKIDFGAFSYSSLTEIVLPEGLTNLGNYAFFHALKLTAPVFPNSLETIGSKCFGIDYFAYDTDRQTFQSEALSLGDQLTFIGSGAFDLFPIRSFTVSEANPFYTSVGGVLLNKAQDAVVEFACDERSVLPVPEGVISINGKALSFLGAQIFVDRISFHLLLPQSLQRIQGSLYATNYLTIHAPVGSFAQNYAADNGITWDESMDMDYYITQISTGEGTLYARVYQDHARVILYLGEDDSLVIPEYIDGVPVTVLGNGEDPLEYSSYSAYADIILPEGNITKSELHSIALPSTLEVISAHALEYSYYASDSIEIPSSVKVLGDRCLPSKYGGWTLPKHLEYIGALDVGYMNPIYICADTGYISPQVYQVTSTVHGFVQLEDNDKYKVIDSSLYSADGKTLLKWAGSVYEGECVVPEGIETIGPYAFYNSKYQKITLPEGLLSIETNAFGSNYYLTEIVLPSTLKSIGSQAFYSSGLTSVEFPESLMIINSGAFRFSESLASVTFNEGLTYIGDYAFGSTAVASIDLPESLSFIGDSCFYTSYDKVREGEPFTLHIGPNLLNIGDEAFIQLPVAAYEVDPSNEVYSSVEGFLFDVTGHFLYAAPTITEESVYVPQNTIMIDSYAFYYAYTMKDLYVTGTKLESVSSIAFNDWYREYAEDGSYEYIDGYWFTLHVDKGSMGERIAINYDIPYVSE